MAYRVKCLVPLLLLAGVLSLLTVAASGQNVVVTFALIQEAPPGQLFKVIGNSTELGNGDPANVRPMTNIADNAWVTSYLLKEEVTYIYSPVAVSSADPNSEICRGSEHAVWVPPRYPYPSVVLTMYWNSTCGSACQNEIPCKDTSGWTILNPFRSIK